MRKAAIMPESLLSSEDQIVRESQILSWRMIPGWWPGQPCRYAWDKRHS